MIVEKKMYSQSGFYFIYSEEVKFTNWDEFLSLFQGHPSIFLSHTEDSLPELISLPRHVEQSEASTLNKINATASPEKEHKKFHKLGKIPSVIKFLEGFDCKESPNGTIFILSVRKEESRELFETMINKGLDQTFLLLVENIT